MRLLILTIMLGSVPIIAFGQWRGPQFEHFDARDGLNSSQIRAICQDSAGYMYFAGFQQLIRYDGRVFEDFTHNPDDSASIGPGQVNQMIVTRDGKIWLAMRRDGINVFDPETQEFRRFDVSVPHNQVQTLLEDELGNLWVGAAGSSLLNFDRSERTFTAHEIGSSIVYNVVQDRFDPDILWLTVSANNAIVRFDRRSGAIAPQPCSGTLKYQDQNGVLWCGSWSGGLWKYDPSNGTCENIRFEINLPSGHHPDDGVLGILPMGDAHWLGSRNAIISMPNSGGYDFILKQEGLGKISEFYKDMTNNVWIGASNGLLMLHPGSQHISYYALNELGSTQRIYPGRLAYDGRTETIYLVKRNEPRLYRIPLDKVRQPDYIETPHRLYGVAVDRQGDMIIAAQSSMYHFIHATGRLEKIQSPSLDTTSIPWLMSMEANTDGIIAGIGYNDFFWFDDTSYDIKHIHHAGGKLSSEAHSKFSLTSDNRAILSGGPMIRVVELESGEEHIIKPVVHAGHVIQDAQGLYWIATISHIGQYELISDSMHLIKYFTADDGLTNIVGVYLHLDFRGRVWIFSGGGMSVVDPVTHSVRNIGVHEGLPINLMDPVQVINLDDGRIATVNSNGVIVFHPDSLWKVTSVSEVSIVLKDLRIANHEFQGREGTNFIQKLDLQPNQNTIDIQFQGLAFPNDRHVTYSYKVDGLHEQWNYLGKNNTVTLSGLAPGSYVFNVKAGSLDSQAPVKRLSIHIETPLYKRAWFIAMCALGVLVGLYLLYRNRIGQVRRQEEEKAKVNRQMAELELRALRAQMNPHFMFNSLNSIKNFILKAQPDEAGQYLSSFAHLIRMILQHSRQQTITLDQELEMLLLYINLEKLRFKQNFEFNCSIDDNLELSQIQIPPMILQPYVENAIWHGLMHKQEDAILSLNFQQQNGHVYCVIEDNGIGRKRALEMKSKSATQYKSMGMGITKDRIDIHNKMSELGIHVDIIDKVKEDGGPDGTKVIVRIPAGDRTIN